MQDTKDSVHFDLPFPVTPGVKQLFTCYYISSELLSIGVCHLISTDVRTFQFFFCDWLLASLQRRLLVGHTSFRIYELFL